MSTSQILFQDDTLLKQALRGRRGRDRMVVRFTTTYAFSTYHH